MLYEGTATEAKWAKYSDKIFDNDINLTVGKSKVVKHSPGWIFPLDTAPLSSVTRNNLNKFKVNRSTIDQKVEYQGIVYTVPSLYKGETYDPIKGPKGYLLSFYIPGTIDGEPFIYARKEFTSRGAGQTRIYFVTGWKKMTDVINIVGYTDKVSGEKLCKDDKGFVTLYYKDAGCTINHRMDGPAVEFKRVDLHHGYYINGKELSKKQHDAISSGVKPEDMGTVIDAMNL